MEVNGFRSKIVFFIDSLTNATNTEHIKDSSVKIQMFLEEASFRANFKEATMCVINCYPEDYNGELLMPDINCITSVTKVLKDCFLSDDARKLMSFYLDIEKVNTKKAYTKIIIIGEKIKFWELSINENLQMLA